MYILKYFVFILMFDPIDSWLAYSQFSANITTVLPDDLFKNKPVCAGRVNPCFMAFASGRSGFAGTKSPRERLISHKDKMLGLQKHRERKRFYLFPGQGGKAARRKHRLILLWSIIFGLFVSAAFAGVLYFFNKGVK